MNHYSFKLPDLGEGIVESEISEWHVQLGDTVEEDQHIADVLTDKAIVEVTAPVSGTVLALACAAGEVLAVGQELIRFETNDSGNVSSEHQQPEQTADTALTTNVPANVPTTAQQSMDEQPQPNESQLKKSQLKTPINRSSQSHEPQSKTPIDIPVQSHEAQSKPPKQSNRDTSNNAQTQPALGHRKLLTSPSIRRRAREQNIDLSLVPGSGPEGRITDQDLEAFIAVGGQLVTGGQRKRQGVNEVKIKGMRRVIAQKMQQSKRQIPHYSYIEEVDITALDELRQHMNAHRRAEQPKLTLLPFIMQALAKLLPEYPHCNAHFDDENDVLTEYEAVHVGIATMTDTGLMVPVIKHCESLDVWQSANEVLQVSQAAREGKANKAQLSGSTITITSLGAIGGIATTPIINAPETAIIGINKLQERPVVKDGIIVVRKMMNLSSSFDHRIVDGFDGAQLVQALKRLLENPATIFI